jgi:putative spermidine/putrescine transport system substrate-binding protein
METGLKKALALTTAAALMAAAGTASAQQVTVLGWGGAYTNSQIEAYHKPFTAQTGIPVISVDSDNPAIPIKAQVEAGNVTADVAVVELADAIRLCDEGLLVEIDPASLPPAPDGTAAADDFLPGTLTDCMVGTDVFSTVFAYSSATIPGEGPTTIADFFDLEKFPGKRGMRKTAKVNLEMALMADGVAPADVYDVLGTDEGVDRAFAKLDTIKDQIVWWEAGAQPPQLLADGEVVMSTAYNGRVFNAAIGEGQPFVIVWHGQVYEFEGMVIPKGAPNMDAALEFVKFSTSTEPQAKAAEWISYGPPRKSSSALVGVFQGDGKTEMGPNLPTYAANLEFALASSFAFWADHEIELNERMNAWLAQ